MNGDTFDPESNLLQLTNQLIAEKHYDGIELLFQDKRNINILMDNTSDFVELCKKHLTDENFQKEPNLYFACENLLKIISKSSSLTEALFELLEIIDSTKSDDVFTSALKALQICLLREDSDRKSLEWGLNEVISYITELEYPEILSKGCNEKQMALLEQDEQIHKILINYITITLFYEPIVRIEVEGCIKSSLFRSTTWDKLNVLTSFLLQLLGRPIDLQRNFSSTTTSSIFLNQLYWNTNLYVAVGRNYYPGFVLQTPQIKSFSRQKYNNFSTSLNNPAIDDFRAREEAKEKEEIEREKLKKENKEDTTKEENLRAVQLKILEASIPFVEQYGWTIDAIIRGAEKAELPGVAHGLFSDGSIDLILYFYSDCNNKLVEHLKQETKNGEILPNKPTEFLVKAIRYRLEMLIPYKHTWPQAMAKMSLPQNVAKSLAQILTMTDDICYFAGDRSVDFGWYIRRVGISTIYKLTELYMLQDKSDNHKDTWAFLQNRMDEAQIVEVIFGQTEEPSQRTKNKLNATFETARNILGLNYDRRI